MNPEGAKHGLVLMSLIFKGSTEKCLYIKMMFDAMKTIDIED